MDFGTQGASWIQSPVDTKGQLYCCCFVVGRKEAWKEQAVGLAAAC